MQFPRPTHPGKRLAAINRECHDLNFEARFSPAGNRTRLDLACSNFMREVIMPVYDYICKD